MKYAILSDIHAYPNALERVLADAKSCGAEKFLCLGDVVGYGPDPVRTIEIVRNTCAVTLMGNHDAAVGGVIYPWDFVPYAKYGVERHWEAVDADGKAWLASLPYTFERASFVCVHGSMLHPESFNYILDAWDARRSMQETRKVITFVGHSHVPTSWVWKPKKKYPDTGPRDAFVVEEGCRYIVNVGSVGYPRSGGCTTYCLYDSRRQAVEFRRLPFDIVAYADAMREREIDLPTWVAERLKKIVGRSGR